jgi:hypothetical protein
VSQLERRRAPRSHVAVDCVLTRRIGGPVTGTTVDLGVGGMSVATTRPLAVDEELGFAFPLVSGRARVLRDHGGDVYGLRFERLPERMLADLARLGQSSDGTTIQSTM